MQRSKVMTVVVLASLALGCTFLWNAANRGYLREDVVALLEENDVHDAAVSSCHMLGSTRAGDCELVLEEEQVADLVQTLALESLDGTGEENALLEMAASEEGSCIEEQPNPQHGLQTWGLWGDHDQLTIDQGSTFSYLVLQYRSADNRVCLQVLYAYG